MQICTQDSVHCSSCFYFVALKEVTYESSPGFDNHQHETSTELQLPNVSGL